MNDLNKSSPGTAIGGYNQCLKKAIKIKNLLTCPTVFFNRKWKNDRMRIDLPQKKAWSQQTRPSVSLPNITSLSLIINHTYSFLNEAILCIVQVELVGSGWQPAQIS